MTGEPFGLVLCFHRLSKKILKKKLLKNCLIEYSIHVNTNLQLRPKKLRILGKISDTKWNRNINSRS